jgi:signal recognition particle subunit SRP54
MFEQLSERLESTFKRLRGQGSLTEDNVREALRDVRRALLEADVHFQVAKTFVKRVEERAIGRDVLKGLHPGQQVIAVVNEELIELMGGAPRRLKKAPTPPTVIMIVGLQGSGKTTFCGKLGLHLRKQKQRVLLTACDVYRPAAIDQLETIGKQIDIPVHANRETENVVAIAKGAVAAARDQAADVVVLDTAGRLHIDDALMQELRDLREAVKPDETLLVLDGMTGQDAVKIGSTFNEALGVDGVVLTKMDGDARGGAVLSIREVTGAPVLFVGTGEKPSDLAEFHPERMASRILGMGDVLTLIDRAQDAISEKDALEMEKKLRKSQFTLEDFLGQLRQIQKMGPLEDLLKMIPGVGSQMKDMKVDPNAMKRIEAIILSMTPSERHNPKILNGSRRKRIGKGSGTSVQEVNQLVKQFTEMNKMMKRFSGMKKGKGPKLPFPI